MQIYVDTLMHGLLSWLRVDRMSLCVAGRVKRCFSLCLCVAEADVGVTTCLRWTPLLPSDFILVLVSLLSFSYSGGEATGREWGREEHQWEVSSGRLATAEKTGSVINREEEEEAGRTDRADCGATLPSPPASLPVPAASASQSQPSQDKEKST